MSTNVLTSVQRVNAPDFPVHFLVLREGMMLLLEHGKLFFVLVVYLPVYYALRRILMFLKLARVANDVKYSGDG